MDELRGTRTSGMARRAAEALRRSDMGVDQGRPGPLPASVELGHRLYSRRARAPRYQLLARAGLAGSAVTPLEVNPWGGGARSRGGTATGSSRSTLRQGFTEYFEPFTGEPLGLDEQSWTATVALDWLAHGRISQSSARRPKKKPRQSVTGAH